MKKLFLIILLALPVSAQILYINNTNPPADSLSNSFTKINGNFGIVATTFAGLTDSDTNAVVRSPRYTFWSTNVLTLTNNVRYQLPITVTNPESVSWTMLAGTINLYWAPAGTTNWTQDQITTNANIVFSFMTPELPAIGTPLDPVLTNITVYALTRPDLLNRTNEFYGQRLRVGAPSDPSDATPKSYVDSAVAGVNYIQNGGIFLQGANLNLNGEWTESAGTNGIVWKYIGAEAMRIENPVLSYATITAISMTNTVVWLNIWTNGVSGLPAPQWTYTLENPSWAAISGVTNTYPTASGTNYTISFQRPNATKAFIRVAQAATLPNFARMSAMLSTAPRTVTNSTDTTWGNGSGLLTWDTNYLYISVGSNLWKRAALSSW